MVFRTAVLSLASWLLVVAPAALAQDTSANNAEGGGLVSIDLSQKPEKQWPYQRPLFALFAPLHNEVHLGLGWATNPDVDSLAFHLAGSLKFWNLQVDLRMPMGLMLGNMGDDQFSYGDLELGVKWLLLNEERNRKHLAVGLNFIAPLSRAGEEKDLAAIQHGKLVDDSNFGKRYLLAQKPLLDMGLIPRLNVGITPYVMFGRNLGRVSLQTDIGCMILVMDNVDESIYGTDRRLGFILFYDLASPVAITEELSLVAEFNGAIALDGLEGTGFAFTLGARYTVAGFTAGAGVQLPLGVDNKPPDDDKMLGRYDSAFLVRHQLAVIVDLGYSF